MATKTRIKSLRLKISTIDEIEELCKKNDRKVNWYIQKILDNYLENLKKKQNDSK